MFWNHRITGTTASHAAYGVGPATDYATPIGTPVHAPFAGRLEYFWTDDGGHGIRIIGKDATFVAQHLRVAVRSRDVAWREVCAESGNSGARTTGPHVHAYIQWHGGKRVEFAEWLRSVQSTPTAPPAPAPAAPKPPPAATRLDFGSENWFFYRSKADAAAHRNPKGGRYGGGQMLAGSYKVFAGLPGGPFQVVSQANGTVWVSADARGKLR